MWTPERVMVEQKSEDCRLITPEEYDLKYGEAPNDA